MVKNSTRIIYLDILKIFACFFVIVNHTQSASFTLIKNEKILFLSMFYFFMSKISVPLFVMTTGALLLKKDIPLKTLFRKYIRKIVLVTLIASGVLFFLNNKSLNMFLFLKTILSKPINITYWYLYMLIGLYLMSPFLKNMVKGISEYHYLLLFILWIIFTGIIPVLKYTYGIYILQFLDIPILGGYVGYYIFGDYINNKTSSLSSWVKILSCITLFLLSTLLVTLLTLNNYKKVGEFLYDFDNVTYIFFIISSLSFFILIKNIVSIINFNGVLEKIIIYISRCTLGIYLIHTLIITYTKNNFQLYLTENTGNFIGLIIFQIFVFSLSLLLVSLLLKIPFVNRLI